MSDSQRWRLVRRLGRGGNAEVWRATPVHGGADAVVKRLARHLAGEPRLAAMLRMEAHILSLLDHECVPRLLEMDGTPEDPLLVIELVDGPSLLELIRGPAEPLPVTLAAHVMAEVCRALGAVHALTDPEGNSLGALHRDVTPSNILIARDGAVKLVDFGISRVERGSDGLRTESGLLKGKARFIAPEVIARAFGETAEVDARADLFSAGVVLHELLTGRRLFEGRGETDTLDRVRFAKIPAPSSARPEVPPALDQLCLRALERDPARRFATAEEMASALEAFSPEDGKRQLASWLQRRADATGTATRTHTPEPRRRAWFLLLALPSLALFVWWVVPKTPPPEPPLPIAAASPSPTPSPQPTPSAEPSAIAMPPPIATPPAPPPRAHPKHVKAPHSNDKKKPRPKKSDDPLRGGSMFDPFEKR